MPSRDLSTVSPAPELRRVVTARTTPGRVPTTGEVVGTGARLPARAGPARAIGGTPSAFPKHLGG